MNLINAIINLINNPITDIREYYNSRNRANSVGTSLEEYVKDLFAGTLETEDELVRNNQINKVFSYLGNQNNPPDSILKGGDAIEVKKIEGISSSLALNSSYPKSKLYSKSSMITSACRNCEEWTEKDLIYIIGVISSPANKLSNVFIVYGTEYAANEEIYLRIKNAITTGVNAIENIDFGETRELGRVNRVDPLGITYLRIRGMWGIENPLKVFRYVYQKKENKEFNFCAIINNEKYFSFSNYLDLEALVGKVAGLEITEIEVKNPNNPALMIASKMITFSR